MNAREQSVWASWINVIAAIWLIISPFILGYTNSVSRNNDIWTGLVVGVLAIIRAFTPARTAWLSVINILAGIWLIIAPFSLHFSNMTQQWNDVILGIIIGVIAVWNTTAGNSAQRIGGHSHA